MRSNQVLWRGLFVMLVVAVGVMSACGGATPAPKEQPTMTPAPSEPTEPSTKEDEPTAAPASAGGETLLQERCTVCHSLGQVERAQKSREEWERTVASMVSRGAELDQDEQGVLIDYLAENYGP